MRFWDREREIEDMKTYLSREPNSILFVYGPKSSGKSTLLEEVAHVLSKRDSDFVFLWYDLREKVLKNVDDVLRIFFKEKGWLRSVIESFGRLIRFNYGAMEIDAGYLKEILERERDAFEEMAKQIGRMVKSGKRVVIVFDEIQMLKDIYLNGDKEFIDSLFNFFVRVTKVKHMAHVVVMTSDTFFIEEVYSSSALKNTSRYYLVDYFDDETTLKILINEGLSEEDARYVVEWIGGGPWMMEEIIGSDEPKAVVRELYLQIFGKVFEAVRGRNDLKGLLKRALSGENLYYEEENVEGIRELVEREVLFFDPINRVVRFQTKLDERAAKELLFLKIRS